MQLPEISSGGSEAANATASIMLRFSACRTGADVARPGGFEHLHGRDLHVLEHLELVRAQVHCTCSAGMPHLSLRVGCSVTRLSDLGRHSPQPPIQNCHGPGLVRSAFLKPAPKPGSVMPRRQSVRHALIDCARKLRRSVLVPSFHEPPLARLQRPTFAMPACGFMVAL